MAECKVCKAHPGKCFGCKGGGKEWAGVISIRDCSVCKGTKVCPACKGTGKEPK